MTNLTSIPQSTFGSNSLSFTQGQAVQSVEEISQLIASKKFVPAHQVTTEDRWGTINDFRVHVQSALNKGLSDIISRVASTNGLIVEVGSGRGYDLTGDLLRRMIRIQPDQVDCQQLAASTTTLIYQMTLRELTTCLDKNGKNIPLIFGVNVFDTMTCMERQRALADISKVQRVGDRILMLHDTNPFFDSIEEDLSVENPDCEIIPFYPKKFECSKASVLIIPKALVPDSFYEKSLEEYMNDEVEALWDGEISITQELHELKEEHNLRVVVLEDYYSAQVEDELEAAGYSAKVYYEATFIDGIARARFDEDVTYKSVTDLGCVKEWSLDDKVFQAWLGSKGLSIPPYDGQELKRNKQRIIGAELLVIEAVKQ